MKPENINTYGYPWRKSNPSTNKIGRTGERSAVMWLKEQGATILSGGYVKNEYETPELLKAKYEIISGIENQIGRKLSSLEQLFIVGKNYYAKGRANKLEAILGRQLTPKEQVFVRQEYGDFFAIFNDKTFGHIEVKATRGTRKLPPKFAGKRQATVFALLKWTDCPIFILRVFFHGKKPEFNLIKWR